MALSEALLPEFDQEMANTRKSLERIPDDKLGWKPHPKSGTMGWLAGHLVNIPEWAVYTINQDALDMAPKDASAGTEVAPGNAGDLRQERLSGAGGDCRS